MRDPGRPGRNPFFDLGAYGRDELGRHAPPQPDDWPDPETDPTWRTLTGSGTATDPGRGARGARRGDGAPLDGGPDGRAGASLFEGLFLALAEASPEAAEHLVTAAHEMVLAVKVIVDAAESALAEHRGACRSPASGSPDVDPGGGPVLRPVGRG